MELKQEYTRSGDPAPKASQKSGFSAQRTEFWAPHEVCSRLAFTFCSRVVSLITILVGVGIKCICTLTSLRLPRWWPSLESYWPLLLNLNPLTLVVCGWRWFNQVQMVKKSFLCPPTLHDLQFYCVRIFFLFGNSRGGNRFYSFLCIFCKDLLHRSHVGLLWWDLEYVWLRT